ncbi:hypothetical protein [Clavibacter michiganensis]|uniref:hypothetical protein n=1 Tax=Clavibacter michiganensis TaxID=28447 RepID=UPI003DA16A76
MTGAYAEKPTEEPKPEERLEDESRRIDRFYGILLAFLIVGGISMALTYNAPILGLSNKTRADQALDVVRGSAALYLGLGSALLGLASAVASYVWGSGAKRDYWFGFMGVMASFAGFVSALVLFPLLWDVFFVRLASTT